MEGPVPESGSKFAGVQIDTMASNGTNVQGLGKRYVLSTFIFVPGRAIIRVLKRW